MGPQTETAQTVETAPTPTASSRASRLRILRWIARGLVFVGLSCAAALACIALFGGQNVHWRALDIEVSARPSWHGETRLILTPLGEVRAATHEAPVALVLSLRGVSLDELRRMVEHPPAPAALERDLRGTVEHALREFAWRQVVLGALGALSVPLLLRRRRARAWLAAPVLGAVAVSALLYVSARTYDRRAFDTPSYTGSLREAGWVISLAREAFSKADALAERLRHVADNLDALYGRLNAVRGLGADVDTIKVLHVSDIHNNPAAFQFIRELAARVRVDLVIDTGDLTDFGTPVETTVARLIGTLPVPYVFVPGNHDSLATAAAVRANRNAVVLEGAPVRAAGLLVLGAPDPSSLRAGAGSVDTAADAARAAGDRLLAAYRSAPAPPDIVAVHDPRQGEPLLGVASVLLCGHEHRAYIEQHGQTVLCNAGTTGAAGARYLDRKEGVPFSAAILYFSRTPHPRLLFIDQVVLDGSLGQYSITRRSFAGTVPTP